MNTRTGFRCGFNLIRGVSFGGSPQTKECVYLPIKDFLVDKMGRPTNMP